MAIYGHRTPKGKKKEKKEEELQRHGSYNLCVSSTIGIA